MCVCLFFVLFTYFSIYILPWFTCFGLCVEGFLCSFILIQFVCFCVGVFFSLNSNSGSCNLWHFDTSKVPLLSGKSRSSGASKKSTPKDAAVSDEASRFAAAKEVGPGIGSISGSDTVDDWCMSMSHGVNRIGVNKKRHKLVWKNF